MPMTPVTVTSIEFYKMDAKNKPMYLIKYSNGGWKLFFNDNELPSIGDHWLTTPENFGTSDFISLIDIIQAHVLIEQQGLIPQPTIQEQELSEDPQLTISQSISWLCQKFGISQGPFSEDFVPPPIAP